MGWAGMTGLFVGEDSEPAAVADSKAVDSSRLAIVVVSRYITGIQRISARSRLAPEAKTPRGRPALCPEPVPSQPGTVLPT